MIKPLELIKVLVSSVCTVPNKRNTRRSTALGETPYLVLCQITRTIQSHEFWMDVAVACREEVCMPVCSELHTSTCVHGSTAAASYLQSFSSPTVLGGGLVVW